MTRILVVADTHLPAHRAEEIGTILGRQLERADVIIHAGDVDDADGRHQLHFDPGSPTQRRRAPTRTVGWIHIDHGRPHASLVEV